MLTGGFNETDFSELLSSMVSDKIPSTSSFEFLYILRNKMNENAKDLSNYQINVLIVF